MLILERPDSQTRHYVPSSETPQQLSGLLSRAKSTHLAEGVQTDPVVNEEAPYFLDKLRLPQGHTHGHAALGLLWERGKVEALVGWQASDQSALPLPTAREGQMDRDPANAPQVPMPTWWPGFCIAHSNQGPPTSPTKAIWVISSPPQGLCVLTPACMELTPYSLLPLSFCLSVTSLIRLPRSHMLSPCS